MDEEAYDEYARYQQATGPPKNQRGGRYEVPRCSLKNKQSTRRACFLMVYINEDKHKCGTPTRIPFSRKKFPQMDSLLDEIGKQTRTPVRYLFKWPSGEEITDVGEVEDVEPNIVFVCSNKRKLYKFIPYGGMEFGSTGGAGGTAFTEKYSRNSHNSRASHKQSPTQRGAPQRAPVNITVICNTNRQSKQSLFIDPQSKQPFEEILANVTEMLEMDEPCVALYSVVAPFKKVDSISSFKRIVPVSGDTFWACGSEDEPIEKSSKSRDGSPMRNGNNQSPPRQRNVGRQNGHQERGNPNRQSNGNARQTNGYYEDSHGRGYQRHQERGNGDDYGSHEEEEQNHSPSRREPVGRQKPVQQSKQKTPRRNDDDDDDRKKIVPKRGRNGDGNGDRARKNSHRSNGDGDDDSSRSGNGDNDDDDHRRRRQNDDDSDDEDKRGRRDSTTEEEMAERAEKMEETKSNPDKDVDY